MSFEYTHDLEASSTASASEVMQNLADVALYAGTVGGTKIDTEDPIDKTGISDRFTIVPVRMEIAPYDGDDDWSGTLVAKTAPTSSTKTSRHRVLLATGQRATLQRIDFYADLATTVAMKFFKNGVQIGDTVNPVVAGTWANAIAYADPGADPLIQLATDDELSVEWYGVGAANAGALRGCVVIFQVKVELCP